MNGWKEEKQQQRVRKIDQIAGKRNDKEEEEGEKNKESIREKSFMTGNGSKKLSSEFMSDSQQGRVKDQINDHDNSV